MGDTMRKMRVWWIRNFPGTPEYHPVKSVQEAIEVIKKLAENDLKNAEVTDNACGLEIFKDGEWIEYYDEEGRDILEIMRDEEDS